MPEAVQDRGLAAATAAAMGVTAGPRPRPRGKPWRVVLVTILLTLAVVTAGAWIALSQTPVRRWIGGRVETPPDDPWPVKRNAGLRRMMLDERDAAAATGDVRRAAKIHALLSQEALRRAASTHEAWMRLRDPQTKLFAESPSLSSFRYQNGAADCFGFLLQSGVRLQPDTLAALDQTLAAERALAPAGALCRDVDARTGADLGASDETRMFGSTEYVKDGLLSVYERYGDRHDVPAIASARARMWEVLDVVLARSAHRSKFGPIPATGSETNGNVLQACSRLAPSAPNGPAYAEMAARLADAYVQQAMPRNHGLPPGNFDFAADELARGKVRLRDHGNEIIPGLSEAYALAVSRSPGAPDWRSRADRWAEPVARMYEILLRHGVYADGTLKAVLDPGTYADDGAPNDNWAYVLNGAYLFTQAARLHGAISMERLNAIDAAADRSAAAVAAQYGVAWEGTKMDGYADTLEGGLYVASHRSGLAPVLLPWVDDQVGLLFSRQREGGVVNNNYLDGNFIRTALLYADCRSGGWTAEPWRDDVRVGFAQAPSGDACLYVWSERPWAGVLRPDRPRHREIMHLPWDWPRLNSWPQWFTVSDAVRVHSAEGLAATPTPEQLRQGIPVDLAANGRVTIRLTMTH